MNMHKATIPLKVVVAFFLGVVSIFLLFLLDEVAIGPRPTFSGGIGAVIFFSGVGGYFLISQYFLSRGNPQAVRKDWPIIFALNFTLLFLAIICLVFEPNKGAKMETLCEAILAVACSYVGAALAARTTRQRLL